MPRHRPQPVVTTPLGLHAENDVPRHLQATAPRQKPDVARTRLLARILLCIPYTSCEMNGMDIEFDQYVCEDISNNGQSLLEGLFQLVLQGQTDSAAYRQLDAEVFRQLEDTYGKY